MPRKLLSRWLPSPERIRNHRALAWLGPAIHHPRLWQVNREAIACGIAVGIFFGLLIPLAQIPAAAATAILLRCNLPAAVAATLVTNPFTFAPVYYLAYRVGALLLGILPPGPETADALASATQGFSGWLGLGSEDIVRLGKPLFVGLAIMACVAAGCSYILVSWCWRVVTIRAWRRRTSSKGIPHQHLGDAAHRRSDPANPS